MQSKRIGVVGPCAAGKSTLIQGLRQSGFEVKHIAQEHSFVQDLWRRMSKVDVLIFLDVSYEVTLQRRRLNWSVSEYQEQLRRLSHARAHADLVIETDLLPPEEVLSQVIAYLKAHLPAYESRS